MTRSHLLVSAAVALLCTGILVIFTDLEVTIARWFSCGPWASQLARQEGPCR